MMSACAPKSPIVTGDLSSLDIVALAFSRNTLRVRSVARWTARRAMWSSLV